MRSAGVPGPEPGGGRPGAGLRRLADPRRRGRPAHPPPGPRGRTGLHSPRRAGHAGFTAYAGLLEIGRPQPGETVVVAAATGPVGSAVGQIARVKGARAVGIAGGPEKCRALTEEFAFDAAVDHRSPTFREELEAATPDGVDVYFENVGGPVTDAVVRRLNKFARIPVCGLVAGYNATEAPPGPDRLPAFLSRILTLSLTVRGFIQDEFVPTRHDDFLQDMTGWVRDGSVRYREDIVDGLERAPEAFRGLLATERLGARARAGRRCPRGSGPDRPGPSPSCPAGSRIVPGGHELVWMNPRTVRLRERIRERNARNRSVPSEAAVAL